MVLAIQFTRHDCLCFDQNIFFSLSPLSLSAPSLSPPPPPPLFFLPLPYLLRLTHYIVKGYASKSRSILNICPSCKLWWRCDLLLCPVYFLLGITMLLLLVTVFYDIPELNLGYHFYLKSDETNRRPDDEQTRLKPTETGNGGKYSKQVNGSEEESQDLLKKSAEIFSYQSTDSEEVSKPCDINV